MKKTEKSKTDTHNEHTADVVQLRRGGAIAACLTVAAAGVLAAILLFGQGLNTDDPEQPADPQESIIVTGSKIYVPDVAGMEADPARKALEDAGFTPVLRMIYDDNVPAGSVVRTEPVFLLPGIYSFFCLLYTIFACRNNTHEFIMSAFSSAVNASCLNGRYPCLFGLFFVHFGQLVVLNLS